MHVLKPWFSGLLLAAVVVASNIDDVPRQCHDVCAPVVSLASSCDDASDRTNGDDDDDDDELNCICNASNASTSIPECDACITEYGNDGRDNDVNDLVQSCSFTTTTYVSTSTSASTATSAAGGITSAATTTSATSATATSSSSSTGSTTSSSTSTGASAAATSDSAAEANVNFNSGMLGLIGAGALAIMNL
ncbi:hypothetical protein PISL3812_08258 [Talaromyces islandicus]|uniref:GPI anchored protein n=1 Tax=Talaromyces islandicus TaxID=28573 RepID=A0A0U1M8C3_TALIS|nr:hypothetical protein PISL3812_08258 [Talaromyces islandicus]